MFHARMQSRNSSVVSRGDRSKNFYGNLISGQRLFRTRKDGAGGGRNGKSENLIQVPRYLVTSGAPLSRLFPPQTSYSTILRTLKF